MPFVKADPFHGSRQLQVIAQADGHTYVVDAETQEVIKDVNAIEVSYQDGLYSVKVTLEIIDPAHIFPSGPIVDGQLVNQNMIEAESSTLEQKAVR